MVNSVSWEICIADYLAFLIERISLSDCSAQRPEIAHDAVAPQEWVLGHVTLQQINPHSFSVIVELNGDPEVSAERSHIDHLLAIPKKRMKRRQASNGGNIVCVGNSWDLTSFVDVTRESLRIGPTQS